MDAAECKHLVLGLIFLKYLSDAFEERGRQMPELVADPASDLYIEDPADRTDVLEERDYYRLANVFWVPPVARWETLRNQAKQPEIGRLLDEALIAIGDPNPSLKNILDKRFPDTDRALTPGPAHRPHLEDRLHLRGQRGGRSRRGLRVFPRPVRHGGGQEGRPVLHARLGHACAGGDALPAQGPHL
jgi:hypothetical protein